MGLRGLRSGIEVDKTYSLPARKKNKADDIIAFAESLPVLSGLLEGQKLKLLPFQKKIIKSICKPKVREAAVSIPRKSGKSSLCAVLCLHALSRGERMAEVYSVATSRDQASILFRMLEHLIAHVPELSAECNVKRHTKEIEHKPSGSIYRALSADSGVAFGLNPTLCINDEYAQAKDRQLYDAMKTAMSARRHPLMITISTQAGSDEHPLSQLLDAPDNEYTYKFQLSAPADADIHDEKVWRACNPALGTYQSIDSFRALAQQAKDIPSSERAFRNLYLNQRINASVEQEFLSPEVWDKCASEFTAEDLRGQRAVLGLDMAAVNDLVGITLYFPLTHHLLPFGFVPSKTLEADKNNIYRVWVDKGILKTTQGAAINKAEVIDFVAELHDQYDIIVTVVDRFGQHEIKRIAEEKEYDINWQEYGQGFISMSPAMAKLEELVLSEKLKHNNNPLLNWCLIDNLRYSIDPAGNRKPTRKGTDKIDVASALLSAIGYTTLHDIKPIQISLKNLFI